MSIPTIAVTEILRGSADAAVRDAARDNGFLTLSGVDTTLGLAQLRHDMLQFFTSGPQARARTIRNKFNAAHTNVYRGFFPAVPGDDMMLEGIDIGPDIAFPERAGDGSDPLTEPTPDPGVDGWHDAAAAYYRRMEELGLVITRTLLRALGEDESLVDQIFAGSISSLRLLHYPPQPKDAFGAHRRLQTPQGERFVMVGQHTDSGFVTLLWQDEIGGLQAQGPDGWVDVPPAPDGLVINFGQLLSDWTGGRIRATPHRVLGGLSDRHSIPFFLEPGVDAVITPLSGAGMPFVYGDFLWERMQQFPNMRGLVRKRAR